MNTDACFRSGRLYPLLGCLLRRCVTAFQHDVFTGRAASILLGLARGSNATNVGILVFVGARGPGPVLGYLGQELLLCFC